VGNRFVRRTPRYSLIVDTVIADIPLKIQIKTRTKMLSLYGCGVDSANLFQQGTSGAMVDIFNYASRADRIRELRQLD
jgi:hypothetical protein